LGEPVVTAARTVVLLAVFLFLVYACFPTKNHYWDGIGFALNVERLGESSQGHVLNAGDSQGVSDIYFNPNHLFYNLSGYLLYKPLHVIFPSLRAHDMLRAISIMLSVATACLLFISLNRWSRNPRLSLWLTLLMALSATWWKFSTDADAYVPSTFFLMLATFLMTNPLQRPSGWKIGLLHAMAMLLHQIAIFFLPAAVVGLWIHPYWLERKEKQRSVVSYLAVAGVAVATAYAWVWLGLLNGGWSSHAFLKWLTSNGSDVFSYQAVGSNVLESLRSLLRVFFGGRVGLALEYMNRPVLIALVGVIVISLVRFVWTLARQLTARSLPLFGHRNEAVLPAMRFLLVWAGVFTTFQFIWLTEYPYYRLFYLPAIIFLVGALVQRSRSQKLKHQGTGPLAAFVVFMAAFNFCAYIFPYSREAATPPIHLANLASASIWKGNEVVLYKDFTCDNWMMRYFNPRTTWFKADVSDQEGIARYLEMARSSGRAVWIDTTLIGQFKNSPAAREWFGKFGGLSEPWGLANEKHYIQFSQVMLAKPR
jgi:hypothetical protein